MAGRTPRHNMSTMKCNLCPARWMINRDNWVAGNKFFNVDDGVFIHGTSLWDSESVNQVPEGSRVHEYELSLAIPTQQLSRSISAT